MTRVGIPSCGYPPRDRFGPPEPIPHHVRAKEKKNEKDNAMVVSSGEQRLFGLLRPAGRWFLKR